MGTRMNVKITEYLDELDKAIDNLADEELAKLVLESGVTEETAKQYAIIEKIILNNNKENT